jgi:hypothetical protein
MINSPMYKNAQFANRFGQFGEMMQRATFWNKMDPEREWRVRMKKPRVMKTIDVKVTPETGGLLQIGSAVFGNVLIDFLDALRESAEKMRARTPLIETPHDGRNGGLGAKKLQDSRSDRICSRDSSRIQ